MHKYARLIRASKIVHIDNNMPHCICSIPLLVDIKMLSWYCLLVIVGISNRGQTLEYYIGMTEWLSLFCTSDVGIVVTLINRWIRVWLFCSEIYYYMVRVESDYGGVL